MENKWVNEISQPFKDLGVQLDSHYGNQYGGSKIKNRVTI